MPSEKKASLADYHVHTAYCGHAQGKIVDYVEVAIKLGISELGFSDHLGRYYLTKSQKRRYWDWGMSQHNVSRYLSELGDVAETYDGSIAIRRGLEIDYVEGAEDLLKSILALFPVDYLLGSVHCLPSLGWKHLAHYTRKDSWPIYEEYFRMVQAAITSQMFDVIAHMDFIWRYVKWPEKKTNEIYACIEDIMRLASQHNVAIEINSNGYLWSQLYKIDDGDPFDLLLDCIKKFNTPITLGSDAHKPEFVGKAFGGMIRQITNKGITDYCVFSNRTRSTVAFP